MSIQNNIDRIRSNISNAYIAIESKGGVLPAENERNSNNLADAITSISAGGALNIELDSIQIITPPTRTEYYGNEMFDFSGMELEIKFTDGPVLILNDKYPKQLTASPAVMPTDVGLHDILISLEWNGTIKSCSTRISVVESEYTPGLTWWVADGTSLRNAISATTTSQPLPCALMWGNGKYVVFPDSSKYAAYSEDGLTWNKVTLPTSGSWRYGAFGGGRFVVTQLTSTTYVYSDDGITWTKGTLPNGSCGDIVYGGGKFVIVQQIASGSSVVLYSDDGIVWRKGTLPLSLKWNNLAYIGGKFYLSSASKYYLRSDDGITWTYHQYNQSGTIRSCMFVDNPHIILARTKDPNDAYHTVVLHLSDDGNCDEYSVFHHNNDFSEYPGQPEGYSDMIYGNGLYIILVYSGNPQSGDPSYEWYCMGKLFYSYDAKEWKSALIPTPGEASKIVYNPDRNEFIAVGNYNTKYYIYFSRAHGPD